MADAPAAMHGSAPEATHIGAGSRAALGSRSSSIDAHDEATGAAAMTPPSPESRFRRAASLPAGGPAWVAAKSAPHSAAKWLNPAASQTGDGWPLV